MRTIIDILRRGNQELFHSSMIAWLLDPEGEHNLGSEFLELFAGLLDDKGCSDLKKAICSALKTTVTTELTSFRNRYDIVIKVGDKKFIIENKVKSIGGISQLDDYNEKGNVVIALGFCEISFERGVKLKYPFITYQGILDILGKIKLKAETDFSVLIYHYKLFLRRELSNLCTIVDCFENGNIENHGKLNNGSDSLLYSDNDQRFLNLYLLEKFRLYVGKQVDLKGAEWKSDKNMQSGVWLVVDELPEKYKFYDNIDKLLKEYDAKLWFHIELLDGALAKEIGVDAGVIQLRCWCNKEKHNNREFFDEFKKECPINSLNQRIRYSTRINKKADTFFLIAKNVEKQELVFSELYKILHTFMGEFGHFTQ